LAELIVLLRGEGTAADRRRTITALERNTPDLGFFVCDANATDDGSAIDAAIARGHAVLVVGSDSPGGGLSDELAWEVVHRSDADVVLLELGTAVGPEWREQLRTAAYADTVIATSSAVPDDLLSLYDRSSLQTPPGFSFGGVAVGGPIWGCVYIRRDAWNIARNARWSRVDLEETVLVPGLVHVLAPTLIARPNGGPRKWVEPARTPVVRRALAALEAVLEPLRVTVDLRCCAFPLSGTQVHALNLVASLAERADVRLSILVPAQPDESVRPHLEALPASVTRHLDGQRIVPTPHVFHRPYQVLTEAEIAGVVTSGARLVVTHQDMILDRTPAYFASHVDWRHHAAITAMTLVAADEVVFFSEHARKEAVRDCLVDEAKTSVVPPGTDPIDDGNDELMPRPLVGRLGPSGPPFVLVMGNAYFHKNRLFALRLAEALRTIHGWEGTTVLAGGRPGDGSSSGDETEFLRDHGESRAKFVDLPRVTDAERRWLYSHASLVLFPTLYEGFGLIPFEAAAAGTPCVYSSRSSVAEHLPPAGALLDLGDVVGTARQLSPVLTGAGAAEEIVSAIRAAGSELTWRRTADSYVDVYHRAMTRPIGVSLVTGREVVVGSRAQMVSSETERRILGALRRSSALRLTAQAAVGAAVVGRRFMRSFRVGG
jgi:glycosyltransferase involved in cell wall biosynthesis